MPIPQRRPARVVAALAVGALAAVGCGSASQVAVRKTPKPTPVATPTPTPTPTPAPTPPPTPPPQSPVPLIVQIENSPMSRPQSGLPTADLIYEYVTEGGITRMSAFFYHAPPGSVGPVRSARIATVQLLQIYGAALLYSGAGQYVEGQLNGANVPHLGETAAAGDSFRVGFRAAPHNLYTDGPHIGHLLERLALPPVGYQLWPRVDPATVPGGHPIGSFTVPISAYEQPSYTWHPELNGYTRSDVSGSLIDANSNQPVVAPTVIVMQVDVSPAPEVHDVTGAIGTRHTLAGTGNAQILTGGLGYDVSYTQGSSGPPQFTLPGGAPAPIAPGLVWIMLVPRGVGYSVP